MHACKPPPPSTCSGMPMDGEYDGTGSGRTPNTAETPTGAHSQVGVLGHGRGKVHRQVTASSQHVTRQGQVNSVVCTGGRRTADRRDGSGFEGCKPREVLFQGLWHAPGRQVGRWGGEPGVPASGSSRQIPDARWGT